LLEGEWSVVKLAESVDLSQPAMSHHLRKLRDAGLVQTRRDAQTIYYSLRGRAVEAVLTTLHELYCGEAAISDPEELKAKEPA
jgi:DNA-binding transcriptional ArsR family regulator